MTATRQWRVYKFSRMTFLFLYDNCKKKVKMFVIFGASIDI